ncbi:MAG TPA: XRE family transcriptional regulator [Oscillospiraceae bacterium]|nr:XRE family transcriptional regulator [Oscillospiraceae bacterium]
MEESNVQIGLKLKTIRKENRLTLNEVAQRMDCSAPFLSMVENGHSSISLSNLQKLLKIYGKTMADLLESSDYLDNVVSLRDAAVLGGVHDQDGVEARLLVNNAQQRKIEPIWFCLQPGASLGPMQHSGEEFCYVIEGQFDVTVVNANTGVQTRYHLNAGDTIYYQSNFPHTWRNASNDRPGIFIGAVTPPSF